VPALICAILSIPFAFCCGQLGIVTGGGLAIAAFVLIKRDRDERARWNYPAEPMATLVVILAIVGAVCSVVMFGVFLYIGSHPEILQEIVDKMKEMQR